MNLRTLALFIVFFGILSLSGQARAGAVSYLTWEWSYQTTQAGQSEGPAPSPDSFTGNGTFTTDATPSGGYYEVTGVTGTMNGETITGILSPGTYEGNDNLLGSPPRQVSVNGVSFVTSVGTDYNIFLDYPSYEMDSQDTSSNIGYDTTGNFVAEEIPEPTQYGFFIVLAAAGFVGLRRFSRVALI